MISRVAYVAMHTSPLLLPGSGDAGGMNVYLDQLSRTMARRGIDVTVFTRRTADDRPVSTEVVESYRVVQIDAGPRHELPRQALVEHVPAFAEGVLHWIRDHDEPLDLVHSHYWLSGRTGVQIKDELSIPLANSFHTLGKAKDAAMGATEHPSTPERLLAEREVIARSDCVIASTPFEFDDLLEHYAASPERLCVSPPGVDHGVFHPGSRSAERERLGLDERPTVLYVGRIQSHKGTETAVRAFAELAAFADGETGPVMHIIGGVSGDDGVEEMSRCRSVIDEAGIADRVLFFDPVPHAQLARHYRAADVVIMPSRSETFGLVAAEAQACGIPVIASNTGGLPYVVRASETGLLVDGHDPRSFAAALRAILDHPSFARRLSTEAKEFSKRFSWDATATRMLELYEGITA